jgi:YebC/PmpR family DNA-binding regulatory protein
MSGHSKWSTIKRQKGANDTKRGLLFTKLGNAITIAAKGGIDPSFNFKLRLAVDKARAANMPQENIKRAIERASGVVGGAGFEEVTYEGYGPGRVGLIISAATDNKNRTLSFVKSTLDRSGGTLAAQGALTWQFKPVGEIVIDLDGRNIDEFVLDAADAGAVDVLPNDVESGTAILQTELHDLDAVRSKLVDWKVRESKSSYKPTRIVNVEDSGTATRVLDLIEKLEDNEDVQEVVSNLG